MSIPDHERNEDDGPERLDRGLAAPTEEPEITSDHPLDKGLTAPDEPREDGE
jgi:hypothetical protein